MSCSWRYYTTFDFTLNPITGLHISVCCVVWETLRCESRRIQMCRGRSLMALQRCAQIENATQMGFHTVHYFRWPSVNSPVKIQCVWGMYRLYGQQQVSTEERCEAPRQSCCLVCRIQDVMWAANVSANRWCIHICMDRINMSMCYITSILHVYDLSFTRGVEGMVLELEPSQWPQLKTAFQHL